MSMSESMALMKAAEILVNRGYCPHSADYVCDRDFDVPEVCARCIRNVLRREARKELRKEVRRKRMEAELPFPDTQT